MFETGKNGATTIYAITSNGTYYKLIIANPSGYLKEYITGIIDSGTVVSFAASGSGTVVFSVGSNYYTHDKNSYSSWSALAAPGGTGTINGICGDMDRIYAQVSNLGLEYIYYLDTGTKTWVNMGQINTTGTFVSLFYSTADDAVYHYRYLLSNNLYFYRIKNGSAILESSPSYTNPNPYSYSFKSSNYYYQIDDQKKVRKYIGSTETLLSAIPPNTANDYALLGDDNIFVGSSVGSVVDIYQLRSDGTWGGSIMSYTPGTSPIMTLKAYNDHTIAIGMTSAGTGGLFVFNINTNELKQLTPMKIQQLDVK